MNEQAPGFWPQVQLWLSRDNRFVLGDPQEFPGRLAVRHLCGLSQFQSLWNRFEINSGWDWNLADGKNVDRFLRRLTVRDGLLMQGMMLESMQ